MVLEAIFVPMPLNGVVLEAIFVPVVWFWKPFLFQWCGFGSHFCSSGVVLEAIFVPVVWFWNGFVLTRNINPYWQVLCESWFEQVQHTKRLSGSCELLRPHSGNARVN